MAKMAMGLFALVVMLSIVFGSSSEPVPLAPCIDLDGGQDLDVKGFATGDFTGDPDRQVILGENYPPWGSSASPFGYSIIYDHCSYPDGDYQRIVEALCAMDYLGNARLAYVSTHCPEGSACQDGACVAEELPPPPPDGTLCDSGTCAEPPQMPPEEDFVSDPCHMHENGCEILRQAMEVAVSPAKPIKLAPPTAIRDDYSNKLERIIALLEEIKRILIEILTKL